jgi:hypothetical protein
MKNPQTLILAACLLFLAACKPANITLACDKAQFIDHVIVDVPLEQGGALMPGTHFTKAWEVTNAGRCDWNLDYALVQVSGPDLGVDKTVTLADPVPAGESSQLSLRLTAPAEPGAYTAEWMLQNADGQQFGTGPDGDRPLTLEFVVPQLANGVIYDFTQSVCLARWDTKRATFLPCDGQDDDQGLQDGYVRVNESPALEGSTRDNSPVIEVKPNNQKGGWIAGFFPPITIHQGDHFAATIGCMDANPGCSVLFELDYQLADGTRAELAEWEQVSDETTADVSVDLSDLAGQEVTLILMVRENGGKSLEARAFWLDARLEQGR